MLNSYDMVKQIVVSTSRQKTVKNVYGDFIIVVWLQREDMYSNGECEFIEHQLSSTNSLPRHL